MSGSCCPCGCGSLQRDTCRTATFATMPQCSNCRCYEHVECTTLSTAQRSDSHSCLLTCAKGYFWQLLWASLVPVKLARQCPRFQPYLQPTQGHTRQQIELIPLKRLGSFFNCTQLCVDAGEEVTEKNKLEEITCLSPLNN